jgi:hypothetical protein
MKNCPCLNAYLISSAYLQVAGFSWYLNLVDFLAVRKPVQFYALFYVVACNIFGFHFGWIYDGKTWLSKLLNY